MVVRRNSDTSSKDLIRNGEENWERWVLRNHVIRDGIWAGTQSPAAAKDLSTKLWGKLTEMGVEKSCSQRWCSRSNSVISSKGSKKVYARKIHNSKKYKTKTHKTPRQKPPIKLQSAVCLFVCLFLLLVLHGDDDQAHMLQSQLVAWGLFLTWSLEACGEFLVPASTTFWFRE